MANQASRSRTSRTTHQKLKLTPGEKLILWRRRLNWNQTRASHYYECSVYNYKLAEYDKLPKFKYKIHDFKLLGLVHSYEECLIYRRRARMSQLEVANDMGYGRYWIRLMETGKVNSLPLLEYWTTRA